MGAPKFKTYFDDLRGALPEPSWLREYSPDQGFPAQDFFASPVVLAVQLGGDGLVDLRLVSAMAEQRIGHVFLLLAGRPESADDVDLSPPRLQRAFTHMDIEHRQDVLPDRDAPWTPLFGGMPGFAVIRLNAADGPKRQAPRRVAILAGVPRLRLSQLLATRPDFRVQAFAVISCDDDSGYRNYTDRRHEVSAEARTLAERVAAWTPPPRRLFLPLWFDGSVNGYPTTQWLDEPAVQVFERGPSRVAPDEEPRGTSADAATETPGPDAPVPRDRQLAGLEGAPDAGTAEFQHGFQQKLQLIADMQQELAMKQQLLDSMMERIAEREAEAARERMVEQDPRREADPQQPAGAISRTTPERSRGLKVESWGALGLDEGMRLFYQPERTSLDEESLRGFLLTVQRTYAEARLGLRAAEHPDGELGAKPTIDTPSPPAGPRRGPVVQATGAADVPYSKRVQSKVRERGILERLAELKERLDARDELRSVFFSKPSAFLPQEPILTAQLPGIENVLLSIKARVSGRGVSLLIIPSDRAASTREAFEVLCQSGAHPPYRVQKGGIHGRYAQCVPPEDGGPIARKTRYFDYNDIDGITDAIVATILRLGGRHQDEPRINLPAWF